MMGLCALAFVGMVVLAVAKLVGAGLSWGSVLAPLGVPGVAIVLYGISALGRRP
jgi:hypothetical protein